MKKFFAVFAMVCAVALFVGCAEEPVEEEIVTEEETLEPMEDTMMEDTMMDDTTMSDTAMSDSAMQTEEGALHNEANDDIIDGEDDNLVGDGEDN